MNTAAKSAEEISSMFQKDFAHLGLEKKESTSFRTNLDDFIKAISYRRFSLLS